jgi:hypothetical protein
MGDRAHCFLSVLRAESRRPEIVGRRRETRSQVDVAKDTIAGSREVIGAVPEQQMDSITGPETLGAKWRRDDRDPMGEGFEHLDPRPASEAHRNDDHVRPGEFGLDVFDLPDESDSRRCIKHRRSIVTPDDSDLDIGTEPAQDREHLADQECDCVDIRCVRE